MKKKKKINIGKFNGEIYAKYIDIQKAVLWKDRELSLPLFIIAGFDAYNTKLVKFFDLNKGEVWIFDRVDIEEQGKRKRVGQEEQWYFPIDMAYKKKINND